MNLLVNPRIESQLASLETSLPHALLLTGERGVGKTSIAKALAGNKLHTLVEPLSVKGDIDHEKGSIRVEQIRQLYPRASAKSANSKVVIIDKADTMSPGAQNAFLKLLEEPPENTCFVLLAEQPSLLLATIHSRVQTLAIPYITVKQSEALLKDLGVTDPTILRQIIFVAKGRPALLKYYRNNPKKLAESGALLRDAQTLIRGSFDEQMRLVGSYSASRSDALALLEAAKTILLHTLSTQPSVEIVRSLACLGTAHERVSANANVRLQLLEFVL